MINQSHASEPPRPTVASHLRPAAIDPDQVMAAAYQLFVGRRYVAAEALCRELIVRDRAYWWCHSLRAAALAELGRFDAALDAVDRGLVHEQGDVKLLRLRTQILAAIGASSLRQRPAGLAAPPVLRRPGYGR